MPKLCSNKYGHASACCGAIVPCLSGSVNKSCSYAPKPPKALRRAGCAPNHCGFPAASSSWSLHQCLIPRPRPRRARRVGMHRRLPQRPPGDPLCMICNKAQAPLRAADRRARSFADPSRRQNVSKVRVPNLWLSGCRAVFATSSLPLPGGLAPPMVHYSRQGW